ncbi:HAMP domain-containing protein [Mycobacterium sp. CBMA293]|uniref:HAMP domain-containing sensor histidine kinase n=1 Tax=unclassified Mycolicibacterium TaxID=2636767 RepID=UPI0012DF938A|nr:MULTISPECIES: ATP-binding protein [unclassified Mycolicibacterium]MUL49723.1 HAMP domain-containing protein [Mycolicibacterium sp. CBMA 360]MUL62635.1 HAMP domain-containing protein [Mycolicibacterium sp. CBMA 335]MUL72546.1 HAMP domain-containing protein [Mycolicibacterium sp. CBMA 311]MUL95053.1 HAMP domain-containing protein [Mycolicibacterium sp. CBMA 230]MUM04089.1 two-component sensor histidine kinase [Mycolicibacterium sp. CBMA 213]
MHSWLNPRHWGIPARSAVLSASVVLIALAIAGAGLIAVLSSTLLTAVDDASAERVRNVASALRDDSPTELDNALLTSDQRVVAVQVIDSAGRVVRRSPDAPTTPLISIADATPTLRTGIHGVGADNDMRISGQRIHAPQGEYTILAAGGSESIESTLKTVAVLLGAGAPIIVAAAAAASYWLVKRSLRSVEAIRARVSDISTSDLSERVPVPRHRDEISELARTMNAMLARIEDGHAAQRRFVGDASHELRSPLAAIISVLEVGQEHPELLNPELTTGTLMPEAYRMQALVEDLLLLARADERGLLLRTEDVDVDVLAEDEATRLRRVTAHTVRTQLRPARISGDAAALTRVLRNLLDNAERHALSLIEISVRDGGGAAELVVGDDGPGIPSDARQRVFDRFVRLDSSRSRSGGGSGLGLSIVAEIVSAHGGQVSIDDRPGGGTQVRVSLPSRQ